MLGASEVATYRDRGYVGPFNLIDREDALAIGARVLARRGTLLQRLLHADYDQNRHTDVPDLFALCTRADVLDRIEDLLGPDLVLWRSRIHAKPPNGAAYPFHQDGAYWRLHDARTSPPSDAANLALSAWFALTDTDRHNGCVELVPGTHRQLRPHSADAWRFGIAATGSDLSNLRPEPMALKAGQFFLFHNLVLHRSGVNASQGMRLGFVARFTVAGVSMGEANAGASGVLVRGGVTPRVATPGPGGIR